jgi:LPS O-antigen subunit length determinant protein (WzzB/FepE family)
VNIHNKATVDNNQSPEDVPFGIEEEIDLLEYLNAIIRYKYRIFLIAMIGAAVVFGSSKLVDDIYMSTTVVAVNIKENPGGVSPKEYRANDALGLIEHDFIIEGAHSNEIARLMAHMRSMRFSQIFIEENNLLPYIFHKRWDNDKQAWLKDFKPDMREAMLIYDGDIRGLDLDDETKLLRINFKTRDALLSADLANKFVKRFNLHIQDMQAEQLQIRTAYLEERLKEEPNIELHRSIYRLLETQLAAESLLYARKDYPLEVIQPAFPALYKTYPNRKQWAALALIGLILLGVMAAIASVIVGKIRHSLGAYKKELKKTS